MAARTTVRKSGTSRSPRVSMKDRVTTLEKERDRLKRGLMQAHDAARIFCRDAIRIESERDRLKRDLRNARDVEEQRQRQRSEEREEGSEERVELDKVLYDSIEQQNHRIAELKSVVAQQATTIRQKTKFIAHLQTEEAAMDQQPVWVDMLRNSFWRLHRRFG